MSVRPYRDIHRRVSRQIMVGDVPIGGDAPITVQTMTNTLTHDVSGTLDQIRRAEEAGVDIVRVSCPDKESTAALKTIVREANVPIVADIHFHYKRALEAADAGAACLRINPGNIGSSDRVRDVVRAAKDNGCAIRIGVNAGSLEKDLLEKYGEPCPDAWWKALSTISGFWKTTIFSTPRFRARHRTCFWPLPPIRDWQRPAIIRCIWASPKPVVCATAP
ncbi:hypothetical protein JCM17845_16680 [Iodidimonas gelatinilytica]|uniref:IspG TIM-barrel domain-containing protein n=1 Tax=Iodidimonas gelatinilytica TaxID=1236966 RepID=A0A5A7N034_9PROT|nr:hypothetical protein JCM17845_16680 [Iodidimonas gelatinilytica]